MLSSNVAAQHPCLRLPSTNTNALPHASLGMRQGVTVGEVTRPGQFPEPGVKHAMRSDAIWGPAWIGARLV
jgi:hypothetical protein